MKIWNLEIWKYGEILKCGENTEIQKYGNIKIWKYGSMEIWKFGNIPKLF